MNDNQDITDVHGGIPPQQHAVSIYGQSDALEDFPVLKAFQQYVDAEQAKAHKRLMSVCIFFTIVTVVIVGVFMFIIFNLNRSGGASDTVRALSEANAAIQRQLLEQSNRLNEQLMKQVLEKNAVPATSAVDVEMQKRNLELQARIQALELEKKFEAENAAKADARKPQLTLSEEKQKQVVEELRKRAAEQKAREKKLSARESKVAEDEKRLHEKEVDLQRRKLYPDAYSPEARRKADEEIRAAKRESQEAQARARAAEEKALLAERSAQTAQQRAAQAEREAIAEKKRVEAKLKAAADRQAAELKAAEERRIAEERRVAAERRAAAERAAAELQESEALAKPAADFKPKIGELRPNGTIKFFDEDDYDIPLE